MNTILLTAGVVALMAAVIGGGLDAFNIKMPVLPSPRVRATLGALGIAFLIAAVLLPENNTDSSNADEVRRQREIAARHDHEVEERRQQDLEERNRREAEERYQSQVSGTCSAVRRLASRSTFAFDRDDRDGMLELGRANATAIRRRLKLLFDKSAPASLRDQARIARGRAVSYSRQARADLNTLRAALPPYPTLAELQAATAQLQEAEDIAVGRLEDAMTQLAGRDCSLAPTGQTESR